MKSVEWKEVKPDNPSYLFTVQEGEVRIKYEEGFKMQEIFELFSNGILSKRDGLVISQNKNDLLKKLHNFLDATKSDVEISELFSLPMKDNDKWDLHKSRKHLHSTGVKEDRIQDIYYRPFDHRYIYFDDVLVARLVKKVMINFTVDNYGLILGRAGQNVGGHGWDLIHITDSSVDLNIFYRGGGMTFPLYVILEDRKVENIIKPFRDTLNALYEYQYNPEQILGYIYGILHSPTYRNRYAEFLKRDFPRIPFTPDKKTFEELSALGGQLIQAHLLKHPDLLDHSKIDLKGKGDEIVEKPEWRSGKLFINKTQWFEPVTKEVYEFYIGGYQVLDKYLKDRKGRNISNEIYHLCFVIQSLQFTIEQMKIIDEKTSSWI